MIQRSKIQLPRLARGFDVVCLLLGLALLIVLAPTLLIVSAKASGTSTSELVRIEGILESCRTDREGAVFTLSGQPGSYRSNLGPPETCTDALARKGSDLHVVVHVEAKDEQAVNASSVIPTYGMIVSGTVLRSASQDVRIARIDAAIFLLLATGAAATLFVLARWMRRAQNPLQNLLPRAPPSTTGLNPG
ncbi:MAG: hypothetical protein ABSE43_18245 [Steroidobacteraceae bacterium]|jgi:hypothetical protein